MWRGKIFIYLKVELLMVRVNSLTLADWSEMLTLSLRELQAGSNVILV